MTRAKFRSGIRVELQCRCGRWKRSVGEKCVQCVILAEQKNADEVKARLRRKLDSGAQYDEHGRPE